MRKGIYCTLLSVFLCAALFVLPILNPGIAGQKNETENVGKSSNTITQNKKPTPAPEINTPKSDETVTFIIEVNGSSLCDTVFSSGGKYRTVSELINSGEIRQYSDAIKKSQAVVKASMRKIIPDINLDDCYNYNTVINGFSVTAPYSSLEKLKKISGVKSVTLASSNLMTISENEPEDDIPKDDVTSYAAETDNTDGGTNDNGDKTLDSAEISDYTVPQNSMTGIDDAYSEGYTGKGKVIAVIDNGFDCNHEAFSVQPVSGRYTSESMKSLVSSVPFNIFGNNNYSISDKIIFAYDYADKDSNTYRSDSFHGTYTAALAAGNNGGEDVQSFKSGAYDAQLVFMKVCSDGSEMIGDDVFLAALDDAAKISPDIINISLGVPRISTTESIFTKITDSLSRLGISLISAAGNNAQNITVNVNEGINSEYTDYGTISYPAASDSVTAVGSADTAAHISDYFITDRNERIDYKNIYTYEDTDFPFFSSEDYTEYVYTDTFGSEDELRIFDLSGKIAVVKRGEISVDEKIKAAEKKGAVGVIMISNEPIYIRFIADSRTVPAAAVPSGAEKYFAENPNGKLTASKSKTMFVSENGGKPSAFTSYGVTSDLMLKPDFLAPGTDIYSASYGAYDPLSGTSVSSAVASGAAAVVSEYVESSVPGISGNELKLAYTALIMNTAERVEYSDGLYYTPRIQGAGIMNVKNALNCSAYAVSDNGCGGVSMGDSKNGEYSFTLTLKNLTDRDIVYDIGSTVQTDKLIYKDLKYYDALVPESINEYADVSFYIGEEQVKELTLPANGSAVINVNLKLSPEAVLTYMSKAENGFYVDGFIDFTPNDESSSICVPLTGYCGSWEVGDIFDRSLYSDSETPIIKGNSLMGVAADGSSYPGVILGRNMITGAFDRENICIGKDTVKNAYDSNTAGVSFIIPNFYLLRDASDYTVTISDKSGKTVFSQNIGTVSSFSNGGYEPYAQLLSSFNSDGLKNLFSALADGEYVYTVSARPIPVFGGNAELQSVSYPFIEDNTAPEKPKTRTYSENGKIYLEARSNDKNGVQGFILYTAAKSGNKYTYADKIDDLINNGLADKDSYILTGIENDGESTIFTYDITQLYRQLVKVKSHSDFTDNESLDQTKLVVRAVDNAYNLSEPVTADAMVSTKVIYRLTDQNGRPVSGVKISLAGMTAVSDKKGIAVFEKVLPDCYGVSFSEIPENYTTEFSNEALFLSIDSKQYVRNIRFNFSGEYPPEEISESKSDPPTEKKEDKHEKKEPDISFEDDNSSFALVFVGILLIISMATLTIRRKRTKPKNQ